MHSFTPLACFLLLLKFCFSSRTLSHLCKMEEGSELDRLPELEREVFSEGEGEETWSEPKGQRLRCPGRVPS